MGGGGGVGVGKARAKGAPPGALPPARPELERGGAGGPASGVWTPWGAAGPDLPVSLFTVYCGLSRASAPDSNSNSST